MRGNEVLVLECYVMDKPDESDNADEAERQGEGYILVGGNSINIQVYSIRTGLLVKEMEGHTDSVTCMALDANILITGSDDHSIRLWNLGNFSPAGTVGTHGTAV
jgi:WD40 repeat protein